MERIYLNDNWLFMKAFKETLLDENLKGDALEKIRIPHTNQETSYHYFDEKIFQGVCGYRRELMAREDWQHQSVLLTFEGAAHEAVVYVNGQKAADHSCGYTAFTVDIVPYLHFGKSNSIVVRLNTKENLNQPPFGHVVDYLTYGGLYRDVYLDIKNKLYIQDVFVRTEEVLKTQNTMKVSVNLNQYETGLTVCQTLVSVKDGSRTTLGREKMKGAEQTFTYQVSDIELWQLSDPALYEIETVLLKEEIVLDQKKVRFGFREAVFKEDGFYLNGSKVKIRGLNRHQSYPYVGYAMPKNLQRQDADILKNELGLNAVRTSHYPQSQYFIDRCDELGLLVFTEMPGWQHIGDKEWQKVACDNIREMVVQYRNHPSIVLWGVRINESEDDEDFYKQTNAIAHSLDPTRQTGGVRCIKHSQLLEDVYTYNDFVHEGDNKGLCTKSEVTSQMQAPYLVSEYNGHMYPTKAFDDEAHRLEHALRHARVLETLYSQDNIAGAFGWCMFDYNTHQDFGSGDRICYHGVMDMFRNPKLAAGVYTAQQEEKDFLEISSNMNIGEHPGGTLGEIYAFTNADSICLYKNDEFIKEYACKETAMPHMPHGPVCIDDFIGSRLETEEGYSHSKSEAVKKVLMAGTKYGMNRLPIKIKLLALKLMLFNGMNVDEGLRLYNKYIASWGEEAVSYRFDGIKNGKVVCSVVKAPMTKVQLEVKVDHQNLEEEHSYDAAGIRIRAVDENGNVLNYFNEPVTLTTGGQISLIGPSVISLKGGMGGTYVKTMGKAGKGILRISSEQTKEVEIPFTIKSKVQEK